MNKQPEPLHVQVDYDVYNTMVDLIVNEISMPYVKAQALLRQIEKGSKAVFPEEPKSEKKQHKMPEAEFDQALLETEVEG